MRTATCAEFRNAVNVFADVCEHSYTDKPRNLPKSTNVRYVSFIAKLRNDMTVDEQVEKIELHLCTFLGCTAKTRYNGRYIRGTCTA